MPIKMQNGLRLLGYIPILLTIAWINGNMTLPGELHRFFQDKCGWPWLSFEETSVFTRCLVDILLLLAACFLSFWSKRIFVLGLSLFVVMSSWQFTGIMLWSSRWPADFSDIAYYILVAASLYCVVWTKKSPLLPVLIYGVALFFTPNLSLDRLLYALASLASLSILVKVYSGQTAFQSKQPVVAK